MKMTTFWLGAAMGAGLMYFFDPQWGKRRRALARDQFIKMQHRAANATDRMGKIREDMANRAQGAMHEAHKRMEPTEPVDDVTLRARVKTALGRVASHPGSIEVEATNGRVILRGPIFANEKEQILSAARAVPGVVSVEDRMEAHLTANNVPGLQGEPAKRT